MILSFFVVFTILSILYAINIKNKNIGLAMYIAAGIILVLLAGLRGSGVDNDYYVYRDFWKLNRLKGEVEDSFYYLKTFVKNFLNLDFQYLLFVYACLGVTIKMISFWKISPYVWGSLLIYFSHYFILHEFTQIRIGVATGFVLLSIFYLAEKKYLFFAIHATLAIFFHQSCFIILLFLLVNNKSKSNWIFALMIPLGYVMYFFNTYLNISVPLPGLQDKIDLYEKATKSGFLKDSKINPFNALFLIRIFLFYILFLYSKRIEESFPKFNIFFKIYSLSFFCFLFLSKIPVFSFRIQELIGIVEIILIPTLIFIFPKNFKNLGKALVWFVALTFILLDIFYNNYILE